MPTNNYEKTFRSYHYPAHALCGRRGKILSPRPDKAGHRHRYPLYKKHHEYDDYLQYAPVALTVGLKAAGYESRSSWGRMLTSDALSVAVMTAGVNGIKYSIKRMRPDGSRRNSFPSGHTATAFMSAAMLHKEYGRGSASEDIPQPP